MITDPESIRALAHPLRLELMDHLSHVDEATATQCADKTGESVASCSFHLRMLAKYGYIEPAERRGREKPWRLIRGTRDMRPSPDVPGSLAAITELATMVILTEVERIRRFLALAHNEDPAWIDAITITGTDVWLTLEEGIEMTRQLQEIATKYLDRNTDASQRPDGARRMNIFSVLNPEPIE